MITWIYSGSVIQAAVDDTVHSIAQYFRISSIRMTCLLHEHFNGKAPVPDLHGL